MEGEAVHRGCLDLRPKKGMPLTLAVHQVDVSV